MSNIPNNGENDHSLRDDLDRLGDAYGQLQHEEPPDLLDQAVLNSAHRAVEKNPGWMQFGWLHGLTTTAVFVLALSLIFNQREQVPVFEDGVRLDDPVGLQPEKSGSEPSRTGTGNELQLKLKEEKASLQDMLRETMESVPEQDEASKTVALDRETPEPVSDARMNTYISEGTRAKKDRADKDMTADAFTVEEILLDEAEPATDTREIEKVRQQSLPAAIAAAPAAAAGAPAEKVDEIEQILSAIIKLKESGNEAWITELASFKQKFPDYPLPDELSD